MPVLILKMSEKEAAEIMEAVKQNGTIHPGNDVCLSCDHIDPEACETCAGGTTLDDNALIPMTNGDRIRAKTDEELIPFIDGKIDFCKRSMECSLMLEADKEIPEEWCRQCAIDWLRTEVGGDG